MDIFRKAAAVSAICFTAALLPTTVYAGDIEQDNIHVSEELVEMLKNMEGFAKKPYWDYGQWTVGYGTRAPLDKLTEYRQNGITREEADQLLREHLAVLEPYIWRFEDKFHRKLTQNEFDAMMSLTYNCGVNWLNNSTPQRAIANNGSEEEIMYGFGLWSTAGGEPMPGLIRRRLCEANLFSNGIYSSSIPSNYHYVIFNAGNGKTNVMTQCFMEEGTPIKESASWNGHQFKGWYTDESDGEKIETLNSGMSTTTLYAQWEGYDPTPVVPEGFEATILEDKVHITVTSFGVNLRDNPGLGSNQIGRATRNDKLTIDMIADCDGYIWGHSNKGWIALKYTNYQSIVDSHKPVDPEPENDTAPTLPEETEPDKEENPHKDTVPENTKPPESEQTENSVNPEEETQPEKEPEKPHIEKHGIVTVETYLNVREKPGVRNKLVKKLKNGTPVVITEERTVDDALWGKCEHGWIALQYVSYEAPGKPETEEQKKPDTIPNEDLKPTEPPVQPDNNHQDLTEDHKPSVQPQNSPQTEGWGTVRVGNWLNVRERAGTNYRVVSKFKDGEKIYILNTKKIGNAFWGQVHEGWICMDYVQFDETTQNNPSEKPNNQNEFHVSLSSGRLRVRSGPGTQYATVGLLENNQSVSILEKNEAQTWGKIGPDKWVCLKYIV